MEFIASVIARTNTPRFQLKRKLRVWVSALAVPVCCLPRQRYATHATQFVHHKFGFIKHLQIFPHLRKAGRCAPYHAAKLQNQLHAITQRLINCAQGSKSHFTCRLRRAWHCTYTVTRNKLPIDHHRAVYRVTQWRGVKWRSLRRVSAIVWPIPSHRKQDVSARICKRWCLHLERLQHVRAAVIAKLRRHSLCHSRLAKCDSIGCSTHAGNTCFAWCRLIRF